MAKKRKISRKKILKFFIPLIILLIVLIFFIVKLNTKKENIEKINSVDSIKEYGYVLDDNETKYYKSLFKQLKECLTANTVDKDKYAKLVTKLFVADVYNLNNKVTKDDIGGVQFVYSKYQSDFKKIAKTTMYKSIKSNLYKNRKQSLPVVLTVTLSDFTQKDFAYGTSSDSKAYYIPFEIEYKKDLGYQTKGKVVLIHTGDKLEVAKLTE